MKLTTRSEKDERGCQVLRWCGGRVPQASALGRGGQGRRHRSRAIIKGGGNEVIRHAIANESAERTAVVVRITRDNIARDAVRMEADAVAEIRDVAGLRIMPVNAKCGIGCAAGLPAAMKTQLRPWRIAAWWRCQCGDSQPMTKRAFWPACRSSGEGLTLHRRFKPLTAGRGWKGRLVSAGRLFTGPLRVLARKEYF